MNAERLPIACVPANTLSIGQGLRRERQRLGWSQERLAEALQTSTVSISRWERDLVFPHPHFQEQLARLFHRSVEDLFLMGASREEDIIPPKFMRSWYVPHLRNPYFTGRQELLQQLHMHLHLDQNAGIGQAQAITGLGGIGKTQMALEYAYRYADDYAAVLWVAAESPETIIESFVHIAEVLELPERGETEPQQIMDAIQRWLTMHPHWLLIWDKAEDLELFQRFAAKVGPGVMLLTTRRQTLGTLAVGKDLPPLSRQESLLFLLSRARLLSPGVSQDHVQQLAQVAPSEMASAQELVMIMDGLPLALDQVGAYVEETRSSFSDYLQLYHHRQAALLQRRGSGALDYLHSVASTWLLDFRRVEQQNLVAAELLRVCAMLHPEVIPEEIFTQGALYLGGRLTSLTGNPFQLDEVISTLTHSSLLHRNREDRTLSMHPLVQVVLRERMSGQQRMQWQRRIIHMLAALFPETTRETAKQCERLLPHMLMCTGTFPDHARNQELTDVVRKATNYLITRAQYKQAEPLYQRSRRVRVAGAEHLRIVSPLS